MRKTKSVTIWILSVGGFIGALGAIIGIPGVVFAVWKSSHELVDTFTTPNISGSFKQITIRCSYSIDANDKSVLDLNKHCLPRALASSILITIKKGERGQI